MMKNMNNGIVNQKILKENWEITKKTNRLLRFYLIN